MSASRPLDIGRACRQEGEQRAWWVWRGDGVPDASAIFLWWRGGVVRRGVCVCTGQGPCIGERDVFFQTPLPRKARMPLGGGAEGDEKTDGAMPPGIVGAVRGFRAVEATEQDGDGGALCRPEGCAGMEPPFLRRQGRYVGLVPSRQHLFPCGPCRVVVPSGPEQGVPCPSQKGRVERAGGPVRDSFETGQAGFRETSHQPWQGEGMRAPVQFPPIGQAWQDGRRVGAAGPHTGIAARPKRAWRRLGGAREPGKRADVCAEPETVHRPTRC